MRHNRKPSLWFISDPGGEQRATLLCRINFAGITERCERPPLPISRPMEFQNVGPHLELVQPPAEARICFPRRRLRNLETVNENHELARPQCESERRERDNAAAHTGAILTADVTQRQDRFDLCSEIQERRNDLMASIKS